MQPLSKKGAYFDKNARSKTITFRGSKHASYHRAHPRLRMEGLQSPVCPFQVHTEQDQGTSVRHNHMTDWSRMSSVEKLVANTDLLVAFESKWHMYIANTWWQILTSRWLIFCHHATNRHPCSLIDWLLGKWSRSFSSRPRLVLCAKVEKKYQSFTSDWW